MNEIPNNSPEVDLSSPTIADIKNTPKEKDSISDSVVIDAQKDSITATTDTNWAQQVPEQGDKQAVTNVVRKDGIDKLSSDADEQSTSYIASSKNTQYDPEHTFKPEDSGYKKSDKKDVWSVKKGEKPTETIKNSDYSVDRVRSEKDERTKSLNDLDEADQHGMRVGYRSSYKTAERIKLLDNLKQYDKALREGKGLTEEEKDLLLETELSKITSYQDRKKSYESKNLSEEDIKILLDEHFKEEISDILESFKDSKGEFNSSTLTIEQLGLLKDTYKRNLVKEKTQDDMTKMDESDQRFREKREKEYLEENPNWTPEAARDKQRIEIAERETELYREQMLQERKKAGEGGQDEQITPDATPITPEETEPEEEAKERKIKRAALIAGVVAGGATGLLAGPAAIGIAGTAVFAGGALSIGAEFIGKRRIDKLQEKISITTDAEEKAKLEKRFENWQKVIKWASRTKSFFKGAGVGLLAGSIVNTVFLDGQGLITHIAEKKAAETLQQGLPVADSASATGVEGNQVTRVDTSTQTGYGQSSGGTNLTSEISNNLSPESLPDRISFNDFPQLKDGLVRRGMDPNNQTLLIKGTSGGWANAQGEVIKKMLNMGINPNSKEAGWIIGDLAAKHVYSDLQINEQAIKTALDTARQVFSSN